MFCVLQALFSAESVVKLQLDKLTAIELAGRVGILLAMFMVWVSYQQKPVYLLDFATFEPPASWRINHDQLLSIMEETGSFTPESMAFQKRLLAQSGCGEDTAWPPGIVSVLKKGIKEGYDKTTEAARQESEAVIFSCVRQVLKKTGLKPKQVFSNSYH